MVLIAKATFITRYNVQQVGALSTKSLRHFVGLISSTRNYEAEISSNGLIESSPEQNYHLYTYRPSLPKSFLSLN